MKKLRTAVTKTAQRKENILNLETLIIATGLVLDGPIRDVKSAKEIPLPIYATGSTPGGLIKKDREK